MEDFSTQVNVNVIILFFQQTYLPKQKQKDACMHCCVLIPVVDGALVSQLSYVNVKVRRSVKEIFIFFTL